MTNHGIASTERLHLANLSASPTSPTFHCAVCGARKFVLGRKLISTTGAYRQKWQCAACAKGAAS